MTFTGYHDFYQTPWLLLGPLTFARPPTFTRPWLLSGSRLLSGPPTLTRPPIFTRHLNIYQFLWLFTRLPDFLSGLPTWSETPPFYSGPQLYPGLRWLPSLLTFIGPSGSQMGRLGLVGSGASIELSGLGRVGCVISDWVGLGGCVD